MLKTTLTHNALSMKKNKNLDKITKKIHRKNKLGKKKMLAKKSCIQNAPASWAPVPPGLVHRAV